MIRIKLILPCFLFVMLGAGCVHSPLSMPMAPVDEQEMNIVLSGETSHRAAIGDSISYSVRISYPNGENVRDGTPVHWQVSGTGSWRDSLTHTTRGESMNLYYCGSNFGVDSLIVRAGNGDNSVSGILTLYLYSTLLMKN